jgi:hypothetical protein
MVKEMRLHGHGVAEVDINTINFILSRFFHYSIEALLHGYPMIVFKLFRFSLVYDLFTRLPKYMQKTMKFSQKAFGYSFFIVMQSKHANSYGYSFKTAKPLLAKIHEHTENDIVYKLMKK